MLDIVRVVNKSDKPVTLAYGLAPGTGEPNVFEFPANGERMVQFEAAAYWFGDPRVQNNPPRDMARREYYDRKKAQWGFHLGFDQETRAEAEAAGKDPRDTWEAKAPQFEVWTVDPEPKRVYMVLDDPTGEKSAEADLPALETTQSADNATLQRKVEELQNQLSQVLTMLATEKGTLPSNPPPAPDQQFEEGGTVTLGSEEVVSERSEVEVPKPHKGPDDDDGPAQVPQSSSQTRGRNK